MKLGNKLAISVFMAAALTMKANAVQPSCESMIGSWVNDAGSTMNIVSIDNSTKMITGTYSSPSGTAGQNFPLVGWVNYLPALPKGNNAHVISFSVRWGQYGSITSWTGICTSTNNASTIKTIWNLARPNSQFDWDHILTNSDTFVPR